MHKLLTTSFFGLIVLSNILPLIATPAQAAICNTDHKCPPPITIPGVPDDKPHDGPGSPGDPYIPPDFTVADVNKNMLIACRVAGTPDDLPNDLKFRNIGDITIPAGTRVYWLISETQAHGFFVLPQDLPVGKSIMDLDVLPQGLPTGDHCLSKIM
jgi:hypothetical protein